MNATFYAVALYRPYSTTSEILTG